MVENERVPDFSSLSRVGRRWRVFLNVFPGCRLLFSSHENRKITQKQKNGGFNTPTGHAQVVKVLPLRAVRMNLRTLFLCLIDFAVD